MLINTFKKILEKEGKLTISQVNSIYRVEYYQANKILIDFCHPSLESALKSLLEIVKNEEFVLKLYRKAA